MAMHVTVYTQIKKERERENDSGTVNAVQTHLNKNVLVL